MFRFGPDRRQEFLTKLQKWDEALLAYEEASLGEASAKAQWEYTKGQLRCLNELGEWRKMDLLCQKEWDAQRENRTARVELACTGAVQVALNLGRWDKFSERVGYLPVDTFEGAFFRAIAHVHRRNFTGAQVRVNSLVCARAVSHHVLSG